MIILPWNISSTVLGLRICPGTHALKVMGQTKGSTDKEAQATPLGGNSSLPTSFVPLQDILCMKKIITKQYLYHKSGQGLAVMMFSLTGQRDPYADLYMGCGMLRR